MHSTKLSHNQPVIFLVQRLSDHERYMNLLIGHMEVYKLTKNSNSSNNRSPCSYQFPAYYEITNHRHSNTPPIPKTSLTFDFKTVYIIHRILDLKTVAICRQHRVDLNFATRFVINKPQKHSSRHPQRNDDCA